MQKKLVKELNSLLKRLNIPATKVELHGFFSALAVVGLRGETINYYLESLLSDNGKIGSVALSQAMKFFDEFTPYVEKTPNFIHHIIDLEDTKVSVASHIEHLSSWTSNFLLALMAVKPNIQKSSQDMNEIIEDLGEIAKVGYDKELNDKEQKEMIDEVISYLEDISFFILSHFNGSSIVMKGNTIN